jgi:uncharacterized protein DUF4397
MKNCIRLSLALALLCAALTTAMSASDNAYMYLVQGIPGHDYSASTDPQFPVDVLLNDEVCYVRGLAYGTILGPLTFTPGTYDVKMSVANSLAPCSNAPIIDSTVTLDSGKNVSAVFALNDSGAPVLSTFTNNFSTVTANNARIQFALAADSSTVQLVLQNTSTRKLYNYTVQPGALLTETVPAGSYTVEVNQGTTTLVPSTSVELPSQSVTLLFATGKASNDSVTLETKTIKDVN